MAQGSWPQGFKETKMPAVSEKQRRFFGAELGRKRAGKRTKTGLSERKLEEFASKRHSSYHRNSWA